MYRRILVVFLAFIFISAEVDAQKAPIDVPGTSVDGQVRVPGSRLFMRPPAGFSKGVGFSGFQQGEQTMIMVMDLVGGNFYTNAATFSGSAFTAKGIKVYDYREMKVESYPAKFVWMDAGPGMRGAMLVFGDTSFSTMITAVYQAGDKKAEAAVFDALNSIRYDKTHKILPSETARFTIETDGSGFALLNVAANMFIYTPGGKDNKGTDMAMVGVTQFPADAQTTAAATLGQLVQKSSDYGLENIEIKNRKDLQIGGQQASEAEIHGTRKGKKAIVYVCSIVGGDAGLIIFGASYEGKPDEITTIRNLVHTIRLK